LPLVSSSLLPSWILPLLCSRAGCEVRSRQWVLIMPWLGDSCADRASNLLDALVLGTCCFYLCQISDASLLLMLRS
jgi:hypothetical protein